MSPSNIKKKYQCLMATVLVSFFTAAVIIVFSSEGKRYLFLDLEIESKEATLIQIFYDRGDGFSQQLAQKRKLGGKGMSQTLRFMLPLSGADAVRIDFEKPAVDILVKRSSLSCPKMSRQYQIDLRTLAPIHDIDSISISKKQARITAAGPDPQILLPLKSTLPNSPFPFLPWMSLALMLYPATWFALRLVNWKKNILPHTGKLACSPGKCRIIHRSIISLSIIFWLMAILHILGQEQRTIALPATTSEHLQVRYPKQFNGVEKKIIRPDGLEISALLYTPSRKKELYPAVLLLHGNYPGGQSHPLYQVLAQELADKDYKVMTIDFAGYGKSEDPFARPEATDVSLETETEAAIKYLAQLPDVLPGGIAIIGHSMGADPALIVGARLSTVSTITLIGPPRRVQERFHSPADIGFFWYWANKIGKEQYGREQFPSWYGKKQWLGDILKRDMIHMLPYLTQLHHKPILFIDSEREPEADKQFLSNYVQICSYPKDYVTLPKANHDSNVQASGKQITYDPAVMTQLVETIDEWNRALRNGGSDWKAYGRNLLDLLFNTSRFVDC